MSATNDAIRFVAGNRFMSEVSGGPAAAQATAMRLNNTYSRCTKAAANASFILPSIGTGEANEIMMVINDSASTINIYPAVGEKNNGSANGAITIAAGTTGVFVPVLNSVYNYPSTLDWRSASIS
jgi:hypothetical protein